MENDLVKSITICFAGCNAWRLWQHVTHNSLGSFSVIVEVCRVRGAF